MLSLLAVQAFTGGRHDGFHGNGGGPWTAAEPPPGGAVTVDDVARCRPGPRPGSRASPSSQGRPRRLRRPHRLRRRRPSSPE